MKIIRKEIEFDTYYLFLDQSKIYLDKSVNDDVLDVNNGISFNLVEFNTRFFVSFESLKILTESIKHLSKDLFIDFIENLTSKKDNTIPLYFLAQTAFGYYQTGDLERNKTVNLRMKGDFQLAMNTTDDLVIFKYLSRNGVRSNTFEIRSIAFRKEFLKLLFNTNLNIDHKSLGKIFGKKLTHKVRLFYLFSDVENDTETQNILQSLEQKDRQKNSAKD